MTSDEISQRLNLFCTDSAGIEGWLSPRADKRILDRLSRVESEPLLCPQLNQLLTLGHEAPLSSGFFEYYWLSAPPHHTYEVSRLPGFQKAWTGGSAITSIDHLAWGLTRLYTDSLLYFGNIKSAYRRLRSLSQIQLDDFFRRRRFDTGALKARGPCIAPETIPKDDRYLIAEMACKSYDAQSGTAPLKAALIAAFKSRRAAGGGSVAIKDLLADGALPQEYVLRQGELKFSADDVLDEYVSSEDEIESKFDRLAKKFEQARKTALENTYTYLSMVKDIDVYVATSMRTREDFRKMASDCETIFAASSLRQFALRYFDPTLSAAAGHIDKGIIECLMVKCAKALVYCAGKSESYGKDAEAAMALSLGKPVIFYCAERARFYREVHPLSRLIEFQTGVVVGVIVAEKLGDVTELLCRIFSNQMEYELQRTTGGDLHLVETLTKSVVRVQSANRMLSETFWNHYHAPELPAAT